MAKTQRGVQVKGQARKVAVKGEAKRVQVTLGDLIAAAFDSVGGEARKVKRVLSSTSMTLATGRHIVVVG